MLTLQGNARLFLCREPVSMRKSSEGLSAIVNELFPEELHSGASFIFISRRRDHMKILTWDGDGFVIFYKRLEQGLFPPVSSTQASLQRREFLMLFEGITPKKLAHRFCMK